MQIPVARMKDVRDAEPDLFGELVDLAQDARDFGARDDAVLDEIVGADPSDGGERALASLPHEHALGLVAGTPDLDRSCLAGELDRILGRVLDFGDRSV